MFVENVGPACCRNVFVTKQFYAKAGIAKYADDNFLHGFVRELFLVISVEKRIISIEKNFTSLIANNNARSVIWKLKRHVK